MKVIDVTDECQFNKQDLVNRIAFLMYIPIKINGSAVYSLFALLS